MKILSSCLIFKQMTLTSHTQQDYFVQLCMCILQLILAGLLLRITSFQLCGPKSQYMSSSCEKEMFAHFHIYPSYGRAVNLPAEVAN